MESVGEPLVGSRQTKFYFVCHDSHKGCHYNVLERIDLISDYLITDNYTKGAAIL